MKSYSLHNICLVFSCAAKTASNTTKYCTCLIYLRFPLSRPTSRWKPVSNLSAPRNRSPHLVHTWANNTCNALTNWASQTDDKQLVGNVLHVFHFTSRSVENYYSTVVFAYIWSSCTWTCCIQPSNIMYIILVLYWSPWCDVALYWVIHNLLVKNTVAGS